jgi:hypothetical protein
MSSGVVLVEQRRLVHASAVAYRYRQSVQCVQRLLGAKGDVIAVSRLMQSRWCLFAFSALRRSHQCVAL